MFCFNCALCSFNLGSTKSKVLKTLEEHIPAQFRKFYGSQLFDKLLQVRCMS